MATSTRSAKRKTPAVKTAMRRTFTPAQKKKLLTAWRQAKKTGISFRAFCRQRRVPESTVRSWINGSVGSRAAVRATAARRKGTTGSKSRRVTRATSKPKARSGAKSTRAGSKAKSKTSRSSKSKAAKGRATARRSTSRSTKARR